MNAIAQSKKGLFNRRFFLLWQGQLVSQAGTNLFLIAMILWIKELSGSALLMSLILIAGSASKIIFSPFGGTLADMVSRVKILVISDLISGLAVTGMALLVLFNSLPAPTILALLFLVSAILGICEAAFSPAVSALIPELVDDERLHSANSLYQSTAQGSSLIGQGMGGVLFGMLGAPLLFLINGVSFLFSSFTETFLKTDKAPESVKGDQRKKLKNFKADLLDGFHYCFKDRGLRSIFFTIGWYHFFVSPLTILTPFYVSDFLKLSDYWTGFLLGGFGGGTLFGFLIAGSVPLRGRVRSRFITSCLLSSAFFFLFLGLSRKPLFALMNLFFIGVIIGIVIVNLRTIMQRITPPGYLGRVFGFVNIISDASMPLGMGIYGLMIDFLRRKLANAAHATPAVFIINGICLFILMFFIVKNRDFQHLLASENKDTAERDRSST